MLQPLSSISCFRMQGKTKTQWKYGRKHGHTNNTKSNRDVYLHLSCCCLSPASLASHFPISNTETDIMTYRERQTNTGRQTDRQTAAQTTDMSTFICHAAVSLQLYLLCSGIQRQTDVHAETAKHTEGDRQTQRSRWKQPHKQQ